MPLNKVDRILIKKLYLLKGCTTEKLPKEFPTKSWHNRAVFRSC